MTRTGPERATEPDRDGLPLDRLARRHGVASLLDVDDELRAAIAEDELPAATRMTRGPYLALGGRALAAVVPTLAGHELYVASGVLLREVALATACVPELIGPGEVVGPEVPHDGAVRPHFTLRATEPVGLIVLGPRVHEALARWPVLAGVLARRAALRHDRAMLLAAIAHLPRIQSRILVLLAHLADGWGRVSPGGLIVPFALTHEALGRFAGARRSTVTVAANELIDQGLLQRLADGSWLLPPAALEAVDELLAVAGPLPEVIVRARVARREARAAAADAAEPRRHGAELRDEASAVVAQAGHVLRRRSRPPG